MKLLSTEAEGVSEAIPEENRPRLVNAAGRVGALLGLQAPPAPPAADGDAAAISALAMQEHARLALLAFSSDRQLAGC